MGEALVFRPMPPGDDGTMRYFVGMKVPQPGDPVFMAQCKHYEPPVAHRRWDTVEVKAMTHIPRHDTIQVHGERVVFDGSHVYPEFLVYYRVDGCAGYIQPATGAAATAAEMA